MIHHINHTGKHTHTFKQTNAQTHRASLVYIGYINSTLVFINGFWYLGVK